MWFRILLFAILIYLVIRTINQFLSGGKTEESSKQKAKQVNKDRKVSKDVGEYIDYEELDD